MTDQPAAFDHKALDADLEKTKALDADLEKTLALDADLEKTKAIAADLESIGDNCELGLYQRQLGLEPISLLRFSSAFLPHLVNALEQHFEGVGRPENLYLRDFPHLSDEIFVELMDPEVSYSLRYHTGVHKPPAERTPEHDAKFIARQSAHARYLVRRLIETLQGDDKLLVFQQNGPMTPAEIDILHHAVRAYGPASLLLVLPADPEHPAGSVTSPTPGLLLGRIDRFAPRHDVGAFSAAGWEQVCAAAHRLWQQQRAARSPAHPMAAIAADFESIGDNAEFGIYQRAAGAEPSSLLRFAASTLADLLHALETRFAGVGDPSNVALHQRPEQSWEIQLDLTDDQATAFRLHTGLHRNPAERTPDSDAAVIRNQSARVRYLVRQLIETLTEADRILVFQQNGPIPDPDIDRLHQAIRAYGPSTLLVVLPADAAHPPGQVVARAPGLLIGRLDRFAPRHDIGNFSEAGWTALCLAAHRLWKAPPAVFDTTSVPSAPEAEPTAPVTDLDRLFGSASAPPIHPRRNWLARLIGL